uniref:Ig-like domain-containing protein n=1 Tax=Sander lucioperca TaxID=283035 RepID=A0A8C9Y2W6_SANLU
MTNRGAVSTWVSSVPLSGEQVGPPVTGNIGEPVSLYCKASGSPVPHISWLLPDGNIVRRGLAVSGGGGRTRRLTVFDNGTLLVPAVGMGEEGEYTCYAENQGVKVMMTSPPTFTDNRSHHVIKVHHGATATIRCQAAGVPAPTVTWLSPSRRVIPQSLGSG